MSKQNVYSYPQRSFTPSPPSKSQMKTAALSVYSEHPQPETFRSQTRYHSEGGELVNYLRQPSENEKRLRADTLLKEIYGREERVYIKEDSQSRSSSNIIDNAFRPKSNEPPYALYDEFKESVRPRAVSSQDVDFKNLFEQVKQKLDTQRSGRSNNPISKSYDNGPLVIHAKTVQKDKSFDPINGVLKKYSIRSPQKNESPEILDDTISVKERQFRRGLFNPITGKAENYAQNRSFTYGEDRLSPVKAVSSSRFNNVTRSVMRPFANLVQAPAKNSSFDSDSFMKLLNSRKVLRGMGYQESKIF